MIGKVNIKFTAKKTSLGYNGIMYNGIMKVYNGKELLYTKQCPITTVNKKDAISMAQDYFRIEDTREDGSFYGVNHEDN